MVVIKKKKKPRVPEPGKETIGEFVAGGGQLPGEPGVTESSLRKAISKRNLEASKKRIDTSKIRVESEKGFKIRKQEESKLETEEGEAARLGTTEEELTPEERGRTDGGTDGKSFGEKSLAVLENISGITEYRGLMINPGTEAIVDKHLAGQELTEQEADAMMIDVGMGIILGGAGGKWTNKAFQKVWKANDDFVKNYALNNLKGNTFTRGQIRLLANEIAMRQTWKTKSAWGQAVKYAASLLFLSLSSKGFSEYVKQVEGVQQLGGASTGALIAKNEEAFAIAIEGEKEVIANNDFLSEVLSWTPYGVIDAVINKFRPAVLTSIKVKEILAEEAFNPTQKTETQLIEESQARARADDAKAQEESLERSKAYQESERQAEKQVRVIKRREDRAFAQEMADFWAEQRRLESERLAQERLAIAEFWLAYNKQRQEIQTASRETYDPPSALNFRFI